MSSKNQAMLQQSEVSFDHETFPTGDDTKTNIFSVRFTSGLLAIITEICAAIKHLAFSPSNSDLATPVGIYLCTHVCSPNTCWTLRMNARISFKITENDLRTHVYSANIRWNMPTNTRSFCQHFYGHLIFSRRTLKHDHKRQEILTSPAEIFSCSHITRGKILMNIRVFLRPP